MEAVEKLWFLLAALQEAEDAHGFLAHQRLAVIVELLLVHLFLLVQGHALAGVRAVRHPTAERLVPVAHLATAF